jgi:hypothetical protein
MPRVKTKALSNPPSQAELEGGLDSAQDLTTNTVARQVSRPCTIGGSISKGTMYGPSPVRKVVAALIRSDIRLQACIRPLKGNTVVSGP